MNPIVLLTRVLRDPNAVLDAEDTDYAQVATHLLATLAVCGALFGAVVGGYRGGIQTVYAAVKMPVLFLMPVLLVLPAMRALFASAGIELSLRRVALGSLVGITRTAIIAAAMSPVSRPP